MSKVLSEENTEKKTQLMQQAIDLALLGQGLLKGEAMSNFMRRSVEMLGKD